MKCYRDGGCGPYEYLPCDECPASKETYLKGRYEMEERNKMEERINNLEAKYHETNAVIDNLAVLLGGIDSKKLAALKEVNRLNITIAKTLGEYLQLDSNYATASKVDSVNEFLKQLTEEVIKFSEQNLLE